MADQKDSEIRPAEVIAKESDKKLKKALSLQDLFFLSMGGIIGSGWLLGVAGAAGTAGPASILSWIIGGVIVLFIALTFAEISGAIPKSGAIVRYPHLAYGGYTGYIMGWAYMLSAVTVPTVEAEAVLTYASTYIHGLFHTVSGVSVLTPIGILAGVILLIAFFFLNWFGIRFLGKFNSVATWWKFIIPTLTFIFLLFMFNKSNLVSHGGFFPLGVGSMFYAIPSAGIVFSYLGFRQALEFGGEAKNPQRDVPRATVYSVLAAIALYTLLQVAFLGAIKWPTGTTWSTLTSSSLGSAPFFTELQYSGIALFIAFSYFLLIDAWISPSGTGWIYLGNGARVLYGISADGYFPSSLLKVHDKTRIPYIALIASLVLGVVFFLPFPSWYLFVGFISSATVLTYIMGPLALMTFRKHAPELHRPFHLPYASLIAPIAFVGGALIVYWSGITTFTMIFYTAFIGIPVFYFLYAPKKLNLSKSFAYAVGITELIVAVAALIINYIYVLYPSSKESLVTETLIFLASLIVTSCVILGFTALTTLKVSSKDKQMFMSSYWLLSLMIVTELFSYFGAFGNDVLIPFPWDTIVMIAVYSLIYVFALRGGHNTEDLSIIVEEQRDSNVTEIG